MSVAWRSISVNFKFTIYLYVQVDKKKTMHLLHVLNKWVEDDLKNIYSVYYYPYIKH